MEDVLERSPIEMNWSKQTLEEVGKYYFQNSLKYYLGRYINIVLPHMSIIERHVAYLCPLCINNAIMLISPTNQKTSSLFTDDHYPPESVGGKKTILVCEKCNTEAGHKYDFALKQHLMYLSFGKRIPKSIIPSQSIIPGVGKFKGAMVIDKKGTTQLQMKKNEKDMIPPLDKWNEDSKTNTDWIFEIKYHTPQDEKITKALLHAAYLTCFENFGYEFIFSKGGELFRNALNDLEEYPVNVNDLNLDTDEAINTLPLGMCFISDPIELQSLVVNIKLTLLETGYSTIKSILIPNPYPSGIEDLKRTGERLKNHLGAISFKQLHNFLRLEEFPAYSRMWNTLQRDEAKRN